MLFVRSFCRSRSGTTAIEYGLLVSLLVLAIIAALAVISRGVNQNFNKASQAISST